MMAERHWIWREHGGRHRGALPGAADRLAGPSAVGLLGGLADSGRARSSTETDLGWLGIGSLKVYGRPVKAWVVRPLGAQGSGWR